MYEGAYLPGHFMQNNEALLHQKYINTTLDCILTSMFYTNNDKHNDCWNNAQNSENASEHLSSLLFSLEILYQYN